jgi:2-keto-myo-inositol isomerase
MLNRRKAIQIFGVTAGMAVTGKAAGNVPAAKKQVDRDFIYCLNMATIRGHKLGFVKELETASAAGFPAVEIWIDSLQEHLNNGGSVAEVKKRLDNLGLKVEDCISFNEWIVDDQTRRRQGLEQMKREMDILARLGCPRIAATGKGTSDTDVPSLEVIAERYLTILGLGDQFGVVPQLEMWGFQRNLSNVAEVLYAAMQSRHASARVLLDVFHLYRGNTPLDTLSLMDPNAVEMFHMNDYPDGYPFETITDADRIYPGDGIAPLKQMLQTLLQRRKKPLVLSVELFNKNYYAQDALTVAKTSLQKMKAVVEAI